MRVSFAFRHAFARLAGFTLALAFGQATFAQQGTGSIFGTVTDAQGALVAGARIEVINAQTGAIFRTQTAEAGRCGHEFLYRSHCGRGQARRSNQPQRHAVGHAH